jgi:hypothetical protein
LLRHKSSSWTHLSTPGDLFLAPKPQFISIMGIIPLCKINAVVVAASQIVLMDPFVHSGRFVPCA